MFIQSYLEMLRDCHRLNHATYGDVLPDLKYIGFADLVLTLGREYTQAPVQPFSLKPNQCFQNAASLALDHPNLTYCEGWAHLYLPTEHAWLIDEAGYVLDPTPPWVHEGQACSYFGVALRTTFLERRLANQEVWGLFNENGYDLLKIDLTSALA